MNYITARWWNVIEGSRNCQPWWPFNLNLTSEFETKYSCTQPKQLIYCQAIVCNQIQISHQVGRPQCLLQSLGSGLHHKKLRHDLAESESRLCPCASECAERICTGTKNRWASTYQTAIGHRRRCTCRLWLANVMHLILVVRDTIREVK